MLPLKKQVVGGDSRGKEISVPCSCPENGPQWTDFSHGYRPGSLQRAVILYDSTTARGLGTLFERIIRLYPFCSFSGVKNLWPVDVYKCLLPGVTSTDTL